MRTEIDPRATVLSTFRHCFFQSKKDILKILCFILLFALLSWSIPFATKIVFDYIVGAGDYLLMLQLGIGLFFVALSLMALCYAKSKLLLSLKSAVETKFHRMVWEKMLFSDVSLSGNMPSGKVLYMSDTAEMFRQKSYGNILEVFFSICAAILYLIPMFFFSSQFTIFSLLVLLIAVVVIGVAKRKMLPFYHKATRRAADLQAFLVDIASSIASIRVSGAEQRVFSLWAEKVCTVERLRYCATGIGIALQGIVSLSIFLGVIGIYSLSIGSLKDELEWMSLGSILGFIAAYFPFSFAIQDFVKVTMQALPFTHQLQDICSLLDSPLPRPKCADIDGKILLKNVSFRFAGQSSYIFSRVNITIEKGEHVAFTGVSGSGKSVLLDLLQGRLQPSYGKVIFYPDVNMAEEKLSIGDRVGVVSDRSKIFSATLFDNIVCGRKERYQAEKKLLEVIEIVGAKEWVDSLVEGVQMQITSGGSQLSSGQCQKILLARALFSEPDVLILDNPLLCIPKQERRKIFARLRKKSVTLVQAVHSVEQGDFFDHVYMLENGQVHQVFDEKTESIVGAAP